MALALWRAFSSLSISSVKRLASACLRFLHASSMEKLSQIFVFQSGLFFACRPCCFSRSIPWLIVVDHGGCLIACLIALFARGTCCALKPWFWLFWTMTLVQKFLKSHLNWLIVDHNGDLTAPEDQVGSLPATAIPVDGSSPRQFPSVVLLCALWLAH
jgi:hypothetical protein